MRIISGKYRGKKLFEVRQIQTRQTSDMVKESVFNMINIKADSIILDLFAGAGSYGIEAISRGANKVYFNDISKICINVINNNIKSINANNFLVYNLDYKLLIKNLENNKLLFDYIFLDPQYYKYDYKELLELVSNILNENGTIILEVSSKYDLDSKNYEIIKEKKYGAKKIYILNKTRG